MFLWSQAIESLDMSGNGVNSELGANVMSSNIKIEFTTACMHKFY